MRPATYAFPIAQPQTTPQEAVGELEMEYMHFKRFPIASAYTLSFSSLMNS
jgi:hypothetical protein